MCGSSDPFKSNPFKSKGSVTDALLPNTNPIGQLGVGDEANMVLDPGGYFTEESFFQEWSEEDGFTRVPVPKPTDLPDTTDQRVLDARADELRKVRAAMGFAATRVTGGQGVTGTARTSQTVGG